MNTTVLTTTVFLAFIFILLLRKGFRKVIFIIAFGLGLLTGIYDLSEGHSAFFIVTVISATFLYYDGIYGVMLLRQAYAEGKIGSRMRKK